MILDDSDKEILEDAKKSYDISISSISSYDTKIQQIIILSTTILALVFTIAGFFNVDYTTTTIFAKPLLYLGYFASLIAVVILLLISLILCLKTFTISEYHIISPINMWNGLSSYTDRKEFMNDLIEEIDYNTKKNSEVLHDLWDKYTTAIALLGGGVGVTILLIMFTIFIKIGV